MKQNKIEEFYTQYSMQPKNIWITMENVKWKETALSSEVWNMECIIYVIYQMS